MIVAKNLDVEILQEDIPKSLPGHLLIKTKYSAISPGTECLIIGNSKDKVAKLGYSASGIVVEIGEGVEDFSVGDRISCYGAPYVQHANYLLVPVNLCAKVPDHVDMKAAALGGLGAITIHALRKSKLQFGETAVVAGLGVLGQLIAQIGHAAAYQIVGYDVLKERSDLLTKLYQIPSFTDKDELESYISKLTNNKGIDAAILCANGKNTTIINDSLNWIRDRGLVNIVGDLELTFSRELMFRREADFVISRAGGPGRYDLAYEAKGFDYPFGFVRWTEGRNVQEFIRLLAAGRINVGQYIQDIFTLDEVKKSYKEIQQKQTSALTKLIKYEND